MATSNNEINAICKGCAWWNEHGDGSQMICEFCGEKFGEEQIEFRVEEKKLEFPIDSNEKEKKEDEFPDDNLEGNFSDVISWRDLPLNIWYKICEYKEGRSKYGTTMKLFLENSKKEVSMVWATEKIANVIIRNSKTRWLEKKVFIKSKGRMVLKNNDFFYKYEIYLK
tara:strand:+ start:965 stop:1468 length:504 start_codon:yes stop_codon:yes gene_type:complete